MNEQDCTRERARQLAAALRPGTAHSLLRCWTIYQPWISAPKSHRQLLESGLINLATDGKQDLAIATSTGRAVAKELILAVYDLEDDEVSSHVVPKARLEEGLRRLRAAA